MLINGKNYNLPTGEQFKAAKAAYARYGGVTEFLNYQAKPMPAWGELPSLIQLAWVASANPDYVALADTLSGWDKAKKQIQYVLDTPGYNRGAMEAAQIAASEYGISSEMRQDISEYYHTQNGTNGKTYERNYD